MYICAGLLALGGVLAAVFVRTPEEQTPRERQPEDHGPHYSCQVCAPEITPLRRTG
jgi:hypothetical protein